MSEFSDVDNFEESSSDSSVDSSGLDSDIDSTKMSSENSIDSAAESENIGESESNTIDEQSDNTEEDGLELNGENIANGTAEWDNIGEDKADSSDETIDNTEKDALDLDGDSIVNGTGEWDGTDEDKQDSDDANIHIESDEKQVDNAEDRPEQIKCRNEDLAGQNHPETGVPFERKQIEVDGKQYEVVVPEFDSSYEAQLPDNMYEASDREQFKECNSQLKNGIESNKELREQFDEEQIEQIEDGDTPDGYTWHHDAESGKMQLVDTETHQRTGHTGGRSFWGGGTDNR